MRERSIPNTFDQFVKAWESGDWNSLSACFSSNISLNSSAFGEAKGREECLNVLKEKQLETDLVRIRVFNNVIRMVSETEAVQSVYTVHLYGKETDGFLHLFQCAFLNNIHYSFEEGNWKMTALLNNMTFECGNSLLAKGKWVLIDYSVLNGNRKEIYRQMTSPFDYPNTGSEEEQIRECFYEYCWDIDTQRFESLRNVYTDPFEMKNEKLKEYQNGKAMSVEDSIQIFQAQRKQMLQHGEYVFPKEAVWNHIAHFEELTIDGNKAHAVIYRYEPNRIGTRFLHRYNYETIYYSGKWNITFRKENNVWKIAGFQFDSGITEDKNEEGRRYF